MSAVIYYGSYLPDHLETKFLKLKSELAGVTYNGTYKRPTYAMVFDYFINQGYVICLDFSVDRFYAYISFEDKQMSLPLNFQVRDVKWHEAANAAIEKTIELIEENVASKER